MADMSFRGFVSPDLLTKQAEDEILRRAGVCDGQTVETVVEWRYDEHSPLLRVDVLCETTIRLQSNTESYRWILARGERQRIYDVIECRLLASR